MPAERKPLREFRVVVVSPSDVHQYRDALEQVIGELNRTDFLRQGIVATTWRWELDAVPALSLSGPQDIIDRQMQIEDCDLVVAIMWTRIGTVGPDGLTGTEHEVDRALAAWGETGRPNVAMYFCTAEFYPPGSEAAAQFTKVLAFKERVSAAHLTVEVKNVNDFERKVRSHLSRQAVEVLDAGAAPAAAPKKANSILLVRRFCAPPDYFATAFLGEDLERTAGEGEKPFWWSHRGETLWLGNMFAFWTKVPGLDAGQVRFSIDPMVADRSSYPELPSSFEYPENTAGRQKVAFRNMVGFTSDETARLVVVPIEFGLKRYVEIHWREFFQQATRCSVFGVENYRPVPSITVAHCAVVTSDGWILLARRSSGRDYFPRAWSVSFEEQVDIGSAVSEDGSGDQTVWDTVTRGLAEEFGVHRNLVDFVRVLCVGRECVLAPTGLVANAAIVCYARLRIPLADLWVTLEDFAGPIDRSENDAWAAIRAKDPTQLAETTSPSGARNVLTLSDISRIRGVELEIFSGSLPEAADGVLEWHPTGPARLGLCVAALLKE